MTMEKTSLREIGLLDGNKMFMLCMVSLLNKHNAINGIRWQEIAYRLSGYAMRRKEEQIDLHFIIAA